MGKEFIELFEKWADTYDESVTGHDIEYKEVFKHYDQLLQKVANRSFGHVLEFGPGTGNLTAKMIEKGLKVTGVEPSPSMRKIAKQKLANKTEIVDGDFLSFPVDQPIDTFVSSYAFHHLTDEEKETAIAKYGNLLASGGKIVFADTMYESAKSYKRAIEKAMENGFHNLAEDLQREYYTTIPLLKGLLEQNGFTPRFEQCNDFVWIMEGVKK
ncbi:class I SAM-dependent methyltransferase [Cytobacillus solani]|uniref:class I SAM-dependent methyltransferase n=1 Tax=Cytobacillus solani TaxID=1637975 RepID=UPI0006AB7E5B|nr:class I SAM-dependent methyltransferase [Cytobacillus solani]KOP83533.1 SAM-dependent methyltransferase [Bacillus sp. FJAT-21945]USK53843.1 class I SAM-dependent methyltransferase [Cytobacillus solani]